MDAKRSFFGNISIHLSNLVFLAKFAAFLAFIALKLKNNEIRIKLTSNDPKNMKKILTFVLAFTTIAMHCWPFFIFSDILNVPEGQWYIKIWTMSTNKYLKGFWTDFLKNGHSDPVHIGKLQTYPNDQ